MKLSATLIFVLFSSGLFAQSFDLLRLNRFLEPSVTFQGRFESEQVNGQRFSGFGAQIGASIPLGGSVKVKTSFGKIIQIREWKDILGVVSLKAKQSFLNIDAEYYDYGYYTDRTTGIMTRGSLGFSGFASLKKTRFFLWGVKGTFAEDPYRLYNNNPVGVRISASGGVATFAKIGLVYYYGAYLAYSDGRFFATPWLGAQARIPGGFKIKVLLPTEIWLSYRFGNSALFKRSDWHLALGLDTRFFRTGGTNDVGYAFSNGTIEYGEIRVGTKVSVDLSKSITFSLHGGSSLIRKMNLIPDQNTPYGYEPVVRNQRPFVEAKLKFNLTKGLFDINLEDVLF